MLIVATIYGLLVWLVFIRLKWLPWNWTWKTITAVLGACLLLAVVGLLNYFTPSGRIAVMGRVVEITPNVSGRVVEIVVEPNRLVEQGTPLFRIDPVPYEIEVGRLEAVLVETEVGVKQMEASLKEAEANTRALRAELELAQMKARDIETLVKKKVKSAVELEKAKTELDSLKAQVDAAESRAESVRITLGSQVNGEQSSVAQVRAQLEDAVWKLQETTIVAPSQGFVSGLTLAVGQRVTPIRSAMGFIEKDSIRINGVFQQNGFRRIVPGAAVRFALSSNPGRLHESRILEIFSGIGQGQVPVSGVLPSIGSIGASQEYGVRIAIPDDVPPESLQLGMSGSATVFAEDSGAIGILAMILLWIKAYLLYL
jgi:multidrug resistance efflux pump